MGNSQISTEFVILIESIKENIKRNPKKGIWVGLVMVNGKEYHWKVTERNINADTKLS
jgi:hypothetical protein